MNIKGIDKAKILQVLYDNSQPLGMGFAQYVPGDMPYEYAQELLKKQTSFDYLIGRVMKIDLSTDELLTDSYNRDNGADKAEYLISNI